MLTPEVQALTATVLLSAGAKANTAAFTSPWIDVRGAEGDLAILLSTGALTGSVTPVVETASDNSGTGLTAITPNEGAFSAVSAPGPLMEKRTFDARNSLGFVRIKGTVVTGPADAAAILLYRKKYL